MTVNRVDEVDVEPDLDSHVHMRWIVGRFDTSDHDRVKRQEEQAISAIKSAEKNKRREELAKALILDPERIKTLAIANTGGNSTDEPIV
jgi:thiamine pyrophosphokinase